MSLCWCVRVKAKACQWDMECVSNMLDNSCCLQHVDKQVAPSGTWQHFPQEVNEEEEAAKNTTAADNKHPDERHHTCRSASFNTLGYEKTAIITPLKIQLLVSVIFPITIRKQDIKDKTNIGGLVLQCNPFLHNCALYPLSKKLSSLWAAVLQIFLWTTKCKFNWTPIHLSFICVFRIF